MTKNQLEGISEDRVFGLGIDTDAEGRYGWGGAAGTRFWVDPERDMVTIFATQLYPGGGTQGPVSQGVLGPGVPVFGPLAANSYRSHGQAPGTAV